MSIEDGQFVVVAEYQASIESFDRVLQLVHELAEASRQEPGNLRYETLVSSRPDGRIFILEAYRSAEDFARHRETPHFHEIGMAQIVPLLESRTVTTLTPSTN